VSGVDEGPGFIHSTRFVSIANPNQQSDAAQKTLEIFLYFPAGTIVNLRMIRADKEDSKSWSSHESE
jgi:hypothetical protein